MSLTSQRSLRILGLAVLLGILGDALLRVRWGVNLPLWLAAALTGGLALRPATGDGPTRISSWPLLAAMFFALCVAWRDAEFLLAWNVVAILCALSIPALQLHGVRLRMGRITDYAVGLAASGLNAAAGPTLLPRDETAANPNGFRSRAPIVGVVLAIPILFVFGGLLMSADPGFDRLVRSLVDWDFETIASHIVLAGFIAWASSGYLRPLATGRNPVLSLGDTAFAKAPGKPVLGMVELGIPLGALALIFLVFIGLQARYLFGGEAVILQTAGLSYAEYARGGFFQLVAVAALLLPVLLGAEWLLDQRTPRTVTRFRMIAAALLVLIALIVSSAILRMRLYMDNYGLTEDRFYAMAFMLWIAVVLILFGATVLRGMGDRFAFGAIVTGFVTLAILNVVNPDQVIARTNLSRAEAGAELDLDYIKYLSDDAVPQLVSRAPALLSAEQCEVLRESFNKKVTTESDWRSWNLGRARARTAVGRAAPCPPQISPQ